MIIFILHPRIEAEGFKKQLNTIEDYLSRKGYTPINPSWFYLSKEYLTICKGLISISNEVWVYGEDRTTKELVKYAKKKNKRVVKLYEKIDYKELVYKNRSKGLEK